MASTTFVDYTTPIVASWLNDVNTGTYTTLPGLVTSVSLKAGSGANTDITSLGGLTTPLSILQGGTGSTTAVNAAIALGIKTSATGSIILPVGTTAQRDAGTPTGYLRYNSTLSQFEGYGAAGWGKVGGGATGGGTDSAFYENDQTITTNYTLTAGKNAMSAGPITIADGVTVTIGTGQTWTIV